MCRGRTLKSSIALEIVGVLSRRNCSSSAALKFGFGHAVGSLEVAFTSTS